MPRKGPSEATLRKRAIDEAERRCRHVLLTTTPGAMPSASVAELLAGLEELGALIGRSRLALLDELATPVMANIILPDLKEAEHARA